MTCWLAKFAPLVPCSGALVRVHLLPRQLMRRELDAARAREAIEDPRSWVPGCGGPIGNGGHHGMLDQSRTLRVPRGWVPAGVEELAVELDALCNGREPFGVYLDRTYGERRGDG